MSNASDGFYKNVTLNDVQLASAYYPILVELARHKHCLTYSELVEKAKKKYPDKAVVQNAIAVSTGRKLDVVRIFTTERNLPDLTSLIINKGSGECGSGFTQHFDPKEARDKVFAYDWNAVSTDFDGYIKHTEKVITPRKRRQKKQALQLMSEFYSKNKDSLPASLKTKRGLIVELLMEGFSPEEAFSQAAADVI